MSENKNEEMPYSLGLINSSRKTLEKDRPAEEIAEGLMKSENPLAYLSDLLVEENIDTPLVAEDVCVLLPEDKDFDNSDLEKDQGHMFIVTSGSIYFVQHQHENIGVPFQSGNGKNIAESFLKRGNGDIVIEKISSVFGKLGKGVVNIYTGSLINDGIPKEGIPLNLSVSKVELDDIVKARPIAQLVLRQKEIQRKVSENTT